MKSTAARFRRLEADKITKTVKALRDRIEERFPGSGLGKVVCIILENLRRALYGGEAAPPPMPSDQAGYG